MKRSLRFLLLLFSLLVVGPAWAADSLSLELALRRVLETYPPLQVAELLAQRARWERPKVESQLGWTLTGQAGVSHDLSFLGTPADRADIGTGLERKLSTGASVGLGAKYVYENNELTFSPLLPNPSYSTNLDLYYRHPLGRGADNPDYKQGLVSAKAGKNIAEAEQRTLRDQVVRQTIDLFYASALTRARMRYAQQAIDRAKRLKKYIRDSARLGLTEEKDLLQAEAQLRAHLAEYQGLQVLWEQQRTALNHLMGRPWSEEFEPLRNGPFSPVAEDFPSLLEEATDNNTELQKYQARVRLAEAAIVRRRDANKNKWDVVLSVGNRSKSGDDPSGNTIDVSDVAGGMRLEYRRALDRQGLDAELSQALLDRSIALQEIQAVQVRLRYELSGLLAEINATHSALDSHRRRLSSEQKKLKEARQRYRTGRTDTSRLIQFENELHLAALAVEQQKIDLARKHVRLEVLRGTLWASVLPEAHAGKESTP